MKYFTKFIVSTLLIFAGLGISQAQYSATFNVTEVGTSNPIIGAEVALNGTIFGNTDGAGMVTFSDLANGTYSYTVTSTCNPLEFGEFTIVDANATVGVELIGGTNNVFFFVGALLTIPDAEIYLSNGDYSNTIISGNFLGDVMENVPYGTYNYTITTPCYETVTGEVTVDCNNGDGVAVFADPAPLETNNVFFFVGALLTIPNAEIYLSNGDYSNTIISGNFLGDIMENVPFGTYNYTITTPCYETVTGEVTVECNNGKGNVVAVDPAPLETNNVFFFVGGLLTIPDAEIYLSNGDYSNTIISGNFLGDIMENVPFGTYNYTITTPCYETVTGEVTVECNNGKGNVVAVDPAPLETNNVFFFVGSLLTIPDAEIYLSNGDYSNTIISGNFLGDIMENVPFGTYNYTITTPCYETVTGEVTVECNNGKGNVVAVDPAPLETNNVFFFVGGLLTIPGADIQLSNDDYSNSIVSGNFLGDIMENVPFGTYNYTITTPCYETVTGEVTVECNNGKGNVVAVDPAFVGVVATVEQDGNTLSAVTSGYNYTWIDCNNNNEPIEGADGQSYTPAVDGNYAVIISNESCEATSECVEVMIIGIDEITDASADLLVYPNPFNNSLSIDLKGNKNPFSIQIFSVDGKLVFKSFENRIGLTTVSLENIAQGTYILEIQTAESRAVQRIVKN